MTEDEGYAAMFHFLNEYWERLRSDDLGGILSSMLLHSDGSPVDPKVRVEWAKAVDKALAGIPVDQLVLTKP